MEDDDPSLSAYRANVGVALFNTHGAVFLGKRVRTPEPYCWQMPQGGIDEGEAPPAAALRELEEETGVPASLVQPLGHVSRWLTYDFPPEMREAKRRRGRDYAGQKQLWFAFRFLGPDGAVNLEHHEPPEFEAWRWGALEDTPDLVIPWKRPVYTVVVREFARFAVPQKT